jgi:hypothetical protein
MAVLDDWISHVVVHTARVSLLGAATAEHTPSDERRRERCLVDAWNSIHVDVVLSHCFNRERAALQVQLPRLENNESLHVILVEVLKRLMFILILQKLVSGVTYILLVRLNDYGFGCHSVLRELVQLRVRLLSSSQLLRSRVVLARSVVGLHEQLCVLDRDGVPLSNVDDDDGRKLLLEGHLAALLLRLDDKIRNRQVDGWLLVKIRGNLDLDALLFFRLAEFLLLTKLVRGLERRGEWLVNSIDGGVGDVFIDYETLLLLGRIVFWHLK